jgi:hypothetical protein
MSTLNLRRMHDVVFIYVFWQRNAIAVVAQNWDGWGWISSNDTSAGGHWGSGLKLNAVAIFSEEPRGDGGKRARKSWRGGSSSSSSRTFSAQLSRKEQPGAVSTPCPLWTQHSIERGIQQPMDNRPAFCQATEKAEECCYSCPVTTTL